MSAKSAATAASLLKKRALVSAQMASDIPDEHWPSSTAMARALVKTMRSDEAVQQRIREDFQTAPALRTIALIRAEWLEGPQKPAERPYKAHEGYYPADASNALEWINTRFLRRLAAERAKSVAANQDFINPAWRRSA